MKYNVKRLYSCIFHLILVAILYCLLRTGGSEFLLKHDESYLPIVPKTSMGSTLFLHYLLFTYFYLSSLNISNPLCQHALKMCKLKDQQSTFVCKHNLGANIPPSTPSCLLKRQRLQNFVKFFDHIKCKNTNPFFATGNSSPFNFTL